VLVYSTGGGSWDKGGTEAAFGTRPQSDLRRR
jgi:hypothetical protein